MVETGGSSFLDLVKQHHAARSEEREAILQVSLASALETYKINQQAANKIGLDQALKETVDFLASVDCHEARIDQPPEPYIGTTKWDDSYKALLGSREYQATLVWKRYKMSKEYEIHTRIFDGKLAISTQRPGPYENVENYFKSFDIEEIEPAQLHNTLFEAYLFNVETSK